MITQDDLALYENEYFYSKYNNSVFFFRIDRVLYTY